MRHSFFTQGKLQSPKKIYTVTMEEEEKTKYLLGQQPSCADNTLLYQGWHRARLEKYLNIQDCLVKSLKIKFALKST